MELDPITVAALEVLNLKSDRLPPDLRRLADQVAWKNPPEHWTDDKTAAYRHLRQVLKAQKQAARVVVRLDTAGLSAKQVRRELCAS